MATVETLLTAEEYGLMPDNGQRTELVRGIVPANDSIQSRKNECRPDLVVLEQHTGVRWSEALKVVAKDLRNGVSMVSVVDRRAGAVVILQDDVAPQCVFLQDASSRVARPEYSKGVANPGATSHALRVLRACHPE